ncbi:class II glutamine amidotransferase [Skermanella sp. TT6]|uniref:Class II glutamine amidotransferase n=1 Tax=Skermanella cutis TaxID=2775420 RepID=A0ABX7B2A9_9PROT|nr:class II glutamine amidotransferase [Skermanella sp. TT6]QQP87330.1 class II glutamine amidotransferase [Skermanella sp. TT6]
MCRWLAYQGRPIPIDTLLFKPANSLIHQSLSAQRGHVPTNGDGFGLGWYGHLRKPGLYRDTMPAWNDLNLRSVSEQIQSGLFFAHVRASTGTSTARVNCHPFRYDRWLFMHNGQIGGWPVVRRAVENLIADDLYAFREGSTDSEVIFYLLLTNGVAEDVHAAFARTCRQIGEAMAAYGIIEPLRLTACLTDGERLYALRHSSDRASPTLFYALGGGISVDQGCCRFESSQGDVLVLSEPLDAIEAVWHEVPEGHMLTTSGGRVELHPFDPTLR